MEYEEKLRRFEELKKKYPGMGMMKRGGKLVELIFTLGGNDDTYESYFEELQEILEKFKKGGVKLGEKMDVDTYELTKSGKIVIEYELEKILKIEEFLLERGVSENVAKEYALAIYNARTKDIDIACKDVEERLRQKMMRDGAVNEYVEEISKKSARSEE